MKSTVHTWLAGVVTCTLVGVGVPAPALASTLGPPPSELPAPEPEGPAGPELPDIEPIEAPGDGPEGAASGESPSGESPSGDAPAQQPAAPIEPPPPTMQQPTVVRVAVGLSAELDGSVAERELLDALEAGVASSPDPSSDVRRLRVGSAEPRELCREGRDDLVINIGYMPDRDDPVLLTYDCRIDEALGIRAREAASDPALLGVLWAEHNQRIADGARERRRARISPKVRTGLIAGAAVVVIGAAVALLIVGAVQRDSVVLVVSPAQ